MTLLITGSGDCVVYGAPCSCAAFDCHPVSLQSFHCCSAQCAGARVARERWPGCQGLSSFWRLGAPLGCFSNTPWGGPSPLICFAAPSRVFVCLRARSKSSLAVYHDCAALFCTAEESREGNFVYVIPSSCAGHEGRGGEHRPHLCVPWPSSVP